MTSLICLLARDVFADHVITATVLLDDGFALWTFFRVGRDPVARL